MEKIIFAKNLTLMSSLMPRNLTHISTFLLFHRYCSTLYWSKEGTGAWTKALKHFAVSSIFIVPSASHRNRHARSGNQNHLATVACTRARNALPFHLSSPSLLATGETAAEGTPHPEIRDTQHWTLSNSLKESHPIHLLLPVCSTAPGTGIS